MVTREELEKLSKEELIERLLKQSRIGWNRLRDLVWKRDHGICQVCGLDISKIKAWYDCGHIVDRFCGGEDEADNVVVMCCYCNQMKPFHSTPQEYHEWLQAGYWVQESIDELTQFLVESGQRMKEIEPNFPVNPTREMMDQALRRHQMVCLRSMTSSPENLDWKWWENDDGKVPEWKKH